MPTSEARVATEAPSRYLGQLCKHFQHKLPVELAGRHGRIDFAAGPCVLDATDNELVMRVTADDPAALLHLQDVVARHLLRFAFRQPPDIDWRTLA